MEYFYCEMRQKYFILMDSGKPMGGQWNYDNEKRPLNKGLQIPKTYTVKPDQITLDVLKLVSEKFEKYFGDKEKFI